jgi:hypothetical protein
MKSGLSAETGLNTYYAFDTHGEINFPGGRVTGAECWQLLLK